MKIIYHITLTAVLLTGTIYLSAYAQPNDLTQANATTAINVSVLKTLQFERLDNPVFDMFALSPGRTLNRNAKSANALKYRLTGHPGMTVSLHFPKTLLLLKASQGGRAESITVYITDVRGKNSDHQRTSQLLGEESFDNNITLDETGVYYFWVGYEGVIPTANFSGVYTGSYMVTVDYFF